VAQALLVERRCVATEGNLCLHNPPSYGEDGIYLDSLRSAGRGGRSACRARAFAPSGRGQRDWECGSASGLTEWSKRANRERVDTA
jgi:hypothetical protein